MKNIAIITARSGSKGLKDKNIKILNGKPLIAYSIQAALASRQFDEIMVSTDSRLYAEISLQCGANVPFLRSEHMSGDAAASWDVVKEVLAQYDLSGKRFDTVCLLQPTSPLREGKDIVQGYHLFEEKQADAVTAVCEMDHSPVWSMTLPPDLSMEEYRRTGNDTLPRQALPTYYRVNGALYIRRILYKGSGIEFSNKREYAYIMDRRKSVDIDTELDFRLAEYMMNNGFE